MLVARGRNARIDINTCTARQLTGVPGIDAPLADSIVRYRKKHRRLKHFDELWRVTGMTRNKFVQLRDNSRVIGERAPQIGTGLPYARLSLTNSTLDSPSYVKRRLGPAPRRETSPPEHLTIRGPTRSAPSAKTKTGERKTKTKRTKVDVVRTNYPYHKKTFRAATTLSTVLTRQRRASGKSYKSQTNDTDLSRVTSSRQSPPADYQRTPFSQVTYLSQPLEAGDRGKDFKASQDDTANITRAWTPLVSRSKPHFRPVCPSTMNNDPTFDRLLPRSSFHADQSVLAADSPEPSTTRGERHTIGRSTVATQTSSPTSPLTPQPDQFPAKSPQRKNSWTRPTVHGVPDDVGSSAYLQYCKDSFAVARSQDSSPSSPLTTDNVKAFERLTTAASDGRWRRKGIESWVCEVNCSRTLDTDAGSTANTRIGADEPSNTDSSSPDLRPINRLLSRHRLQPHAVTVCDSGEPPPFAVGTSGEMLRARLLEARQRAKSYREQQQRLQQQQQQSRLTRVDIVAETGATSRDSPTTRTRTTPGVSSYSRVTPPRHGVAGWRPRHVEGDRQRVLDSRVSKSFHLHNNATTMLQGKRPPCASSPTGSLHDMPKRPAMLHASELIARLRRERRSADRLTKTAKKSERRSGTSSSGARSPEMERRSGGDPTANFDDGDRIRADDGRRKDAPEPGGADSGALAALLASSSHAPDVAQKLPTPIKPQQSAYYKYYQQYFSRHCKDSAGKAGDRNEACKVM